jgi:hypothetical protein
MHPPFYSAQPKTKYMPTTNPPTPLTPEETDALIIADKELRRDLDAQLQKLKSLRGSREHNLSITKLQECIMWLGMSLKSLNDERPYPSSYDPTNTKVEPTADGLKL